MKFPILECSFLLLNLFLVASGQAPVTSVAEHAAKANTTPQVPLVADTPPVPPPNPSVNTTTSTTTVTPPPNPSANTTTSTTTVTPPPNPSANTTTSTTSTTEKPPANTTTSTTTTPAPGNTTTVSTTTTSTSPAAGTTVAPHKDRSFDGASFFGGIILTVGLIALCFMGLKYYRLKYGRNYHTL